MSDLSIVFSPLVWLMGVGFGALLRLTQNAGLSILLLSVVVSLLLSPLQRAGMRMERKVVAKMRAVNVEVAALRRKGLRGEALFDATELVYRRYDYHPIQAVAGAAGFVIMLPVLISSILLFKNSPVLVGQSFLFVQDLSLPDHVLGVVNILPLVMLVISMTDAMLRYPGNRAAQGRFAIVSLILLLLVFSMPAGLVLYWIGSNCMAFISARLGAPADSLAIFRGN